MKVYKYRCTKDIKILERDIETFSKNMFFAPKFETFDDKLEATFKEQISTIVHILGKTFSKNTEEINNSLTEVTNYKDKIGIYCVTKRYDNEYMWENYANINKGYCIEYDLDKLTDKSNNLDFSNMFEIIYDDKSSILNISDIGSNSLIIKMFGVKKTKYLPEEEIRLIFNFDSIKKHHKSAITGIYFGSDANEQLIEKFYKKFENRDIKFYRIIKTEKHKLETEIINQFSIKLKYNIEKYSFKILKHDINEHLEIYHIHLIDQTKTELIKEFTLAFNEKYCYKICNLHIYNNSEIIDLLDIYPLSDKDYVRYADSYIANADFSSETIFFEFPFKDFKYDNLKKIKLPIELKNMTEKLFTNKIFKLLFILYVGIDLINSILRISSNYDYASTIILRYFNLLLILVAFISFFIITKYSLPIIKIYIIFKLIIFPIFMILYGLKEYLFYGYIKYSIETYFEFVFSLLIGIIIYYFYKKYRVENI